MSFCVASANQETKKRKTPKILATLPDMEESKTSGPKSYRSSTTTKPIPNLGFGISEADVDGRREESNISTQEQPQHKPQSVNCECPEKAGLDRRGEITPWEDTEAIALTCIGCDNTGPTVFGFMANGPRRNAAWTSAGDTLQCSWSIDPAIASITTNASGSVTIQGLSAGEACLKCLFGGFTLCINIKVYSSYGLLGRLGYEGYDNTLFTPARGIIRPKNQRVDLLFHDPIGGTLLINGFLYSPFLTAHTDDLGFFNFPNVSVDGIALRWWPITRNSNGTDNVVFSDQINNLAQVITIATSQPINVTASMAALDPSFVSFDLGEINFIIANNNDAGAWNIASVLHEGWSFVDQTLSPNPSPVNAEWNRSWAIESHTDFSGPEPLIRISGSSGSTIPPVPTCCETPARVQLVCNPGREVFLDDGKIQAFRSPGRSRGSNEGKASAVHDRV